MPARTMLDIHDAADFAAAFGVSRETMARLETYASVLQQWQRTMNLVSPATLSVLWQRHFADSAQLLPLVGTPRSVLDLGSGAGFPGLVLAALMAERGGCAVHLVESNARKCAFLAEAARQMRTSVEIHRARIEYLVEKRRIESVEVVTARALAPLGKLLGYAREFMAPGARCVFLKGREIERELLEARRQWRFDLELAPSRTDPEGQIAVISSIQPNEEG